MCRSRYLISHKYRKKISHFCEEIRDRSLHNTNSITQRTAAAGFTLRHTRCGVLTLGMSQNFYLKSGDNKQGVCLKGQIT